MTNLRYVYIRNDQHNQVSHSKIGSLSFGYRWNNETKTLDVTAAFCSPKDRFNKKKARMILNGRMNSDRFVQIFTVIHNDVKEPKYMDVVEAIRDSFVQDLHVWDQYIGVPERLKRHPSYLMD
jgi:hypothetical protein